MRRPLSSGAEYLGPTAPPHPPAQPRPPAVFGLLPGRGWVWEGVALLFPSFNQNNINRIPKTTLTKNKIGPLRVGGGGAIRA